MDFFAYGSLTFEEVMIAVTGKKHSRIEAKLTGFARYRVSGATYPALVQSAGLSVRGIIYTNVSPASFDLLDRFEGEYYKRQSVDVTIDEETGQSAETYIICEEFKHLLSQVPWDCDHFAQNHLNAFLSSYKGFVWIEPH